MENWWVIEATAIGNKDAFSKATENEDGSAILVSVHKIWERLTTLWEPEDCNRKRFFNLYLLHGVVHEALVKDVAIYHRIPWTNVHSKMVVEGMVFTNESCRKIDEDITKVCNLTWTEGTRASELKA